MSDQDEKPSPGLPPQVVKLDEVFQVIFGALRSPPSAEPDKSALMAAGAYEQYVQQLVHRLAQEVQHVLAKVREEPVLTRMIGELQNAESSRKVALQPYLTVDPPAKPAGWSALVSRMRRTMVIELETIRDSRLRIELFRAELINQRRGDMKVRIVLRGGAQVRLHFGGRPGDATPQD